MYLVSEIVPHYLCQEVMFLGVFVSLFVFTIIPKVVVVASFTEIKTGYRGFETNKIRYFICLLLAVIISRGAYMNQDLQLEMAIKTYVNMIFAQYKVKM